MPGCLNFSQFCQIYPNAPWLKFMQNSGMNLYSTVSPRVKILVVDDYPNTAALLARAISKLGDRVEVVSATSGHQALDRVGRDAADILITDMDMPDMSGLELIKRLQPSTGRPILSFLITAAPLPDLELTADQLNVRAILRKPINPQKICQLISQVLEEMDLSRFELLNLSPLIWEMANEFQPQADAKRQLLAVGRTEPNSIIWGDGLKIREALWNLTGNAIKSAPPGGVVIISLKHEAGIANVKIHDTGYSIPLEDLRHILIRFYCIRNNEHTDIEGNRLGLAMVKSIAEAHGGNLTVENEPGNGTCFSFRLPLAEAATTY
jgi:CheY-like chemotaxis protein